MYLRDLVIRHFRGIEEVRFTFHKGLNVIVGENNTGKTTVLDAMRLCLGLGYQRREIYIRPEDFFIDQFGKVSESIEFDLIFDSLSHEEEGVFIELLVINGGKSELKLHVQFTREEKNGVERIRRRYWGGTNEGQQVPEEILELLYFVHLGALRDAEQDLSPGARNRLGQLLTKLLPNRDDQKKYASKLNQVINGDTEWKKLRDNAIDKISDHLAKATLGTSEQEIDIDFVPLEFKGIVEQLKIYLPLVGMLSRAELVAELDKKGCGDEEWKKYFWNPEENELRFKQEELENAANDGPAKSVILEMLGRALNKLEVYQNGLGYNNLIFISTVLGDIIERKKIEKESYVSLLIEEPEAHLHPQLQETLFNYLRDIEKQDIQVFITSHSPTITAKTNIDSIIVTYDSTRKVGVTALSSIIWGKGEKKKLERFLDVTKAQLFFAKGVILVEGISEALLVPLFADMMDERYNLDKQGIEIVNVGGTSFKPFARLFNSNEPAKRLGERCAILTDDDRGKGRDAKPDEPSSRSEEAKKLEQGNVKVRLATQTFEWELFAKNADVIKEEYAKIHPETAIDTVDLFIAALERNRDKAEFAQSLAFRLQTDDVVKKKFIVPDYIIEAIKWVIDGK